MSEWSMKRFWTDVTVKEQGPDFTVLLDGRLIKTPAKRTLVVPTRRIADQVAAEWAAQEGAVDPATMPWTRSANAAIDKVAPQRAEVQAHLADYAGTDLLCYRAEDPDALVERQRATWDPILDWLDGRHGVRLVLAAGVMPVKQDPAALAVLAGAMDDMGDFQLTGFYDLVTLTGSFALALANADCAFPATDLWEASRLDEAWQIEQWGPDDEAEAVTKIKRAAFLHATELFHAA